MLYICSRVKTKPPNPSHMATITNNYWNHTGKYQKEYDAAWEALIPNQGEAEDGLPEALRSIARIYYDYYNNGFMNAHTLEQGEWDDWSDDYEQVKKLDSYYQDRLDYLCSHLPYSLWSELDEWILKPDYASIDFYNNGDDVLDRVVDCIMKQIIEEKLIPTEVA